MLKEETLELSCLAWFERTGWNVAHGPDISPDGSTPEREDYRDVILSGRLLSSLQKLNPQIPLRADLDFSKGWNCSRVPRSRFSRVRKTERSEMSQVMERIQLIQKCTDVYTDTFSLFRIFSSAFLVAVIGPERRDSKKIVPLPLPKWRDGLEERQQRSGKE